MKKTTLLIVLMALLSACQTTDPATEKANVEAAITGFYDAVQQFKYEAIPTFVTSDFGAYEEGFTYNEIDGFVNTLQSFDAGKVEMKLDFVKTEVSGNMAFSIVKFDANIFKAPAKIHFQTYENYILKKVNGNWLIHYFHSTHLPDPADKNLSSIHLLKVPDNLSVTNLKEYLNKVNEAIASLGYVECGYKVLTVDKESNKMYNYVIQGNWKNKETYQIIHESDVYKKATTNAENVLNEFFKNQIYVQVQQTGE